MPRLDQIIAALLALVLFALVVAPSAARAEKRIALVIGNAGYQAGALATPANDAGLIAQTLQAAGFDVAGARDLDQDSMRRAFRDFLEKATSSGSDTVAFIYVSGYGLQLEGENYIVPIDAKIARATDVAAEAVRLSDYTRPLAALKLKAGIVVLDAARANSFARSGDPLAGGLALVEPEPGLFMAFNAAPGTVAPDGQGPYGPYAQALAEMMRDGGLPLAAVFDRTRLRVNDVTKGAEVPWHASKVEASLVFFERAADAPPPAVATEQAAEIRARPIREFGAQEAYIAALDRDTLEGYSDFIAAYPADPMAARVRAIIAARREALTWRRTCAVNTPPAYWSYLRRYPQGPHAGDAHRRLAFLAAALEPPPSFTMLAYDLPPPPPEEIVYIRRPVLVFDDPVFAFAPPPPPPVVFLAPPPPEFAVLPPPPPPVALFVLPMPVYRPVPVWVRPPTYVAPPPPNNVIYNNVHNTVVINNVSNTVTITRPSGQTRTIAPPPPPPPAAAAPGAPAPAPAAVGPALPPSVAQKAATLRTQSPPGTGTPNSAAPGTPAAATTQPPGRPLPGMHGQPLPRAPGAPAAPSAAVAPGAPPPLPSGTKPGAPPAPAPTAMAPTATTPPPTAGAKPGAPSSHAPAAKLAPPAAPGATTGTTSPAKPAAAAPSTAPPTPGTGGKPTLPPAPATGHAVVPPASPAIKPATPPPAAHAMPAPPHVPPPAAKLAPPPSRAPPPAAKPTTPPPAPPAAKLVTPPPSPPPPAAKPAAPPTPPAAAAARPMPAPGAAPKVAQPQPKGCPPGKTMAVVNGQPTCK